VSPKNKLQIIIKQFIFHKILKMKKIIFVSLLFFCQIILFAGNTNVDSLRNIFEIASDKQKIEILKELNDKVAETQVKYKTEKSLKEKEINKLKIQKNKLRNGYLYIGIILFVILIIVFYFRFKIKRKLNKVQQIELEERNKTENALELRVKERTKTLDDKIKESEQQKLATLNILQDVEGVNKKLLKEISEREHAQKIQKVLYNISNAINTTDNLEKLIVLIKEQLSDIIDTTNFYIALYDSETDMLSMPFISDEKDEFASFPAGKTLTYYVIKTQKSLMATKDDIGILEQSGEIESFGTNSEIWLGVPLKVEGKVTGVIAVQSYENENAYSKKDLDILEFVSHQISILIERKKTEQDLKKAFEKATESDRLKTAFLNTMSHELRTPLNAVNGFSEIISEDLPMPQILEYNKIINDSGTHLLNIINDLFDISFIESGEVKVYKEYYNISEVINEVNKIILIEQKNANKNNIDIRYKSQAKDDNLVIYTDKQKLKQILINLLKNSIKFTHEGYIEFNYKREVIDNVSMLKFWVKDTGIGIPKEKQDMIFDVFRQVDDSHTRKYGGTGIGLSVSKRFTELLGGKMWVESEEGKGSIFYFTLPELKPETIQKSISSEVQNINSFSGKTILVAEDDLSSYSLLKVLLRILDVKTIHANNGKEAIELSKRHPEISMVLMDVKMPEMNGYEATKQIKKFLPELTIVAQTAYAMQGDNEKAIEAGCDDYISKPIKKKKLYNLLEKHLS